MESVPRTPTEYRVWWEMNTNIPYGYCWCGCGELTPRAQKSYHALKHVRGEPTRYLRSHNFRTPGPDYIEEDRGYTTPCWVWQKTRNKGYGTAQVKGKTKYAHRHLYEQYVEPIPEGCHLHHRCPTTLCVNPQHLQPLAHGEHMTLHMTTERRRLAGLRLAGNKYTTKLSAEEARTIKEELSKGARTTELAASFGISRQAVTDIKFGRTWRDVN